MIRSCKKPPVYFPTVTGDICSFRSQYADLPLKSCVSTFSDSRDSASLGKCDNNTASLWSIDNSFNGDVEFNQLLNNKISGIESLNGVTFNFNSNGITKVDVGENRTNVAIVKLGMNTSVNFELNHVYYMGGDLGSMRDYYNYSNNTYIGTYIGHIQGSPNIRKITGDEGASTSAGEIHVGLNVPAGTYYVTCIFIDLTQMFGSTIADYIYNLEQTTAGAGVAFFKSLYPDDYYAYNAGTKQLVGDTLATFNFGQTLTGGSIDWKTGIVTSGGNTYPLGGVNILTQQGVNHIFCDTGNTTLDYLKAGR